MVKRIGKYEVGRVLGEGTFGKVKYAVDTETHESVAIKILDKVKIQKQTMTNQIKKEIAIMKMVKHKNVVSLREVLASRTKIFIVLEFVTGGELFDKIVEAGKFDEKTARKYFRQLVNGVEYCHQQSVAHRDLKPENLLVDVDENLKVSDFGLSSFFDPAFNDDESPKASLLHTTCGTPNYVAPEVLEDKGYNGFQSDIWSMGVILYVLLAGFLPFDEPTMSALFRKIKRAEYSFPSWFSNSAKDLLGKILVADPSQRMTISDIVQHPWFVVDEGVFTSSGKALEAPVSDLEIKPSTEDVAGAFDEGVDDDADADHDDDDEGAFKELNAFELITLVNRDLTLRHVFKSHTARQKHRTTNFMSPQPAKAILATMQDLLKTKGCEITHTNEASFVTKANLTTSRGSIDLMLHIYGLAGGGNFVTIRRLRGDIMKYSKFQAELLQAVHEVGIISGSENSVFSFSQ